MQVRGLRIRGKLAHRAEQARADDPWVLIAAAAREYPVFCCKPNKDIIYYIYKLYSAFDNNLFSRVFSIPHKRIHVGSRVLFVPINLPVPSRLHERRILMRWDVICVKKMDESNSRVNITPVAGIVQALLLYWQRRLTGRGKVYLRAQ